MLSLNRRQSQSQSQRERTHQLEILNTTPKLRLRWRDPRLLRRDPRLFRRDPRLFWAASFF